MFQKLLLAVDDSAGSQVAVSFATALAQPTSASVHVVYVNEFLVGGRGLTLHTQAEATALVAEAVSQLRSAGIDVSGSVCAGSYHDVAKVIVDRAQHTDADAIVLGSSRRTRLGRLFSRQLRDRTTRLTALPVITSPPPLKVSSGALDLDSAIQLELQEKSIVSQ